MKIVSKKSKKEKAEENIESIDNLERIEHFLEYNPDHKKINDNLI